jgi:threonine/homoserine/homoserine lactone efflux protein
MTVEIWLSLALFVIASAVTPGPNNLLLLASGLNIGVRSTLPLMLGVSAGFATMLVLTGLGLGAAIRAVPWLEWAMLIAGSAYLLWLAWKIARTAPDLTAAAAPPRFGFWHGFFLQAINPKAWMMALTAAGLYLQGSDMAALMTVVVTFVLLGLPCNLVWVMGGAMLSGLRAQPGRLLLVNRVLAAMLAGSVALVLLR